MMTEILTFAHHNFHSSAPQRPLFTVSMETGKKWKILRWSQNLWVHLIEIFRGVESKIMVLRGQTEPQSPHFHISMATVQNFEIPTPLRCSLTPKVCLCSISLRSVEKRRSSWRTEKTSETACLCPQQTPIIVWLFLVQRLTGNKTGCGAQNKNLTQSFIIKIWKIWVCMATSSRPK